MNTFVKQKLIEIKEVLGCDYVLLDKLNNIIYKSDEVAFAEGWITVNVFEYKLIVKEYISDESISFLSIILSVLDVQLKEIRYNKWHKLLLGESVDLDDFDVKYKNQTNVNVWIIIADDIIKYIEEIKFLFEVSIPVVIKDNKLAIIHFENYDHDAVEGVLDHIESEFMIKSKIVIGSSVSSIKDVNKSYDNANQLVKYIFRTNSSKSIFKFEDMLIENLIGKLEDDKLEEIYLEYCRINDIEKLNFELIETIRAFFENNLNITDTASSLFLHRNTLIYRINRIESFTKLDIRKFEDAFKMKILLLIKNNI